MLSYAFQILNYAGYKNIAIEKFDNIGEMFTAILIRGIELQLKQYLNRDYVSETDSLSTIRGKIEINESINSMSILKRRLVCSYDEFSINSYMNQILKSTMLLLIKADISIERKEKLSRLLQYFISVKTIDLHHINWRIHCTKNNQTYQMLMGICFLTINGLLQTQSDGSTKLMDFLDEQRMCHLYEKFLLEYIKKHFPEFAPSASQIPWKLDDKNNYMLPTMKTDITLQRGNEILIIDAKYYSHNTQEQFDKHTVISGNLYQIFTYVKNKEFEMEKIQNHKVSGLLLYAKTNDEIQPDSEYSMYGNKIGVKNLNLNCEFDEIKKQLNSLIINKMNL